VGSVYFFDRIRVDDPVGAISVHGICGIWGVIAVGLFAAEESDYWKQGLFLGGGTDQLLSQLLGVAAIVAFTAVTMTIIFMAIKYTIGLRVSPNEEVEGLDVHEHGYAGYGVDVVTGFSDGVLTGSTGSPSGKQV
jgi:Amt family ammonium transporter